MQKRPIANLLLRNTNIKKIPYIRFLYRILKLSLNSKNFKSFKRDFVTNYQVLIKKNKNTNIDYFGFKLYGYLGLLTTMREQNEYYKLKGSNCVLDLGGFIWDSALEIIKNSQKVYVFEPQNENFEYVLKNIKENNLVKKVFPFNYLVSKESWDKRKLYWWSFKWRTTTVPLDCFSSDNYDNVNVINIKEVIEMDNFDAIKMDIEWWEFEIIDYFLDNEKDFTFSKWIIEFHFSNWDEKSNLSIFKKFVKFLELNNYNFYFYRSIEPDIKFNINEFEKKYPIPGCLCYFEKNNIL